jgi:hypothetical protein
VALRDDHLMTPAAYRGPGMKATVRKAGFASIALVVALACASPALGAQRYAEPGGDGPEPCDQSDPCDIQDVVENGGVQDGDEVILLPGDYAVGSDQIDVDDDIEVHGQDGQPRPRIMTSAATGVLVNNAPGAVVRHLEIEQSAPGSGTFVALFLIDATAEEVLVHSSSASSGTSACEIGGTTTIRDSVCWNSSDGTFTRAVGTNTFGGTQSLTLRNVTAAATGTGSTGILTSGSGSATITYDAKSVIADGTATDVSAAVDDTSSSVVNLDHSNYATRSTSADPGGTATVTDPSTANNQMSAPVFVNAATGNFRQQSSSPTIDKGDVDGSSGSSDFDGDGRALDGDADCTSAADIGADEFKPVPPNATITSGPANGSTVGPSPAFEFTSPSGPAACTTFECRLDGGGFSACTSPHALGPLGSGSHSFRVRAKDVDDQTGSAVIRTFTVDAAPPQTTISSGPANGSTIDDPTPTFGFSSSEDGSTFQCKVDGASFSACTSPKTTSPLPDGSHTFQARATDGVGNTDASPATRSFTVDAVKPPPPADTTAPDTNIDKGPKKKVKTRKKKAKVKFLFSSADPSASFECSLDEEAFEPCTSPDKEKVKAKPKPKKHTFDVRAIDAAGNVDQTPDELKFKVKRKR